MPDATYSLLDPGFGAPFLLVRSDGLYIPLDLGNMDYQQFLTWVAAGNSAPEGWTGPTNSPPP